MLVTVFNQDMLLDALSLAAELRKSGLNITCYPTDDKLAKQLKYADRAGFQFVILRGPDEIARDEVTIKDLRNREQFSVPRSVAAAAIRQKLDNPLPS